MSSERKRRSSRERRRSRSRSRSRSRDRRRSRERSRDRSRERRRRSRTPEEERLRRRLQEEDRAANPDDYTVFVQQIHPKVDERVLFEFFSLVGRVEDVRLIRDQRTQKSKGLAYIEFADKLAVPQAVALTGQLLAGYPVTIQIVQSRLRDGTTAASDSMKLYIGNLHVNVSESDLKPLFEPFGPIDNLEINKDSSGHSRCFGWVTYRRSADAKSALSALNGLDVAGRPLKVGLPEHSGQPVSKSGGGDRDGIGLGELDDDASGGFHITAQGRAQLMAKLSRGTLPNLTAPPTAPPRPNVPLIQVTTCMVIKNMFNPAEETEPDWDQIIREDVTEEVEGKYGKIKHIFVDKNSQGHVYMRLAGVKEAEAAGKGLNGRWFASRQLVCEFLPEATYLMKFPEAAR